LASSKYQRNSKWNGCQCPQKIIQSFLLRKKKLEGLRQQNVVFGFFKVSKALQMAMYKKYNPEKKIARASGSKM
jgi:hypothetical protein